MIRGAALMDNLSWLIRALWAPCKVQSSSNVLEFCYAIEVAAVAAVAAVVVAVVLLAVAELLLLLLLLLLLVVVVVVVVVGGR